MRAIAVVAVILFHANFQSASNNGSFSGGYLGVDVFFVISGYLITSIILTDLKDSQFSIGHFYERRARRLLPALFTVMAVSVPLAWLHLPPKEMIEYAGSVVAALFFVSNFWFWQENSYMAVASQLKPFLHTWSLSVEEQFYLLYPAVLILVWKFARKYLTAALAVILLLSLLLAQYQSAVDPEGAFYLLPTRIWELMGGALLATIGAGKPRAGEGILGDILAIAGLVLIFGSMAVFDEETRHPSFLTVAPVVGTMLVIWYSNPGRLPTKILSFKPLVWIGLLSYSLYLWHFMVFAFVRSYLGDPSDQVMLASIAVSLLGAVGTFLLIENPMRNRQRVSRRLFVALIVPAFLVLVGVNAYLYLTHGAPSRFPFEKIVENTSSTGPAEYQRFGEPLCGHMPPSAMKETGVFDKCRKEEQVFDLDKTTYFLWGDSHVWHLYVGFLRLLPSNTPIIARSISSCQPFLDYTSTRFNKLGAVCAPVNEQIFDDLVRINPDYVVFAAYALRPLEDFKHTVERVKASVDSKILVVGPSPDWATKPLAALQQEYAKTNTYPQYLPFDNGPRATLDEDLAKLALEMDVEYVSAIDVFCKEGKCQAHDGEQLYSLDHTHMWPNMSEKMVEVILDKLHGQ